MSRKRLKLYTVVMEHNHTKLRAVIVYGENDHDKAFRLEAHEDIGFCLNPSLYVPARGGIDQIVKDWELNEYSPMYKYTKMGEYNLNNHDHLTRAYKTIVKTLNDGRIDDNEEINRAIITALSKMNHVPPKRSQKPKNIFTDHNLLGSW